MTNDSFGIGLVGAGFIASEAHAPSVDYLPGVHVAGIQNRTRENGEALAEACRDAGRGDPTVYGDGEVAALAADPEVDGLWVTTPNFVRADAVEAAVDAIEDGASLQGIALEKPIARNLLEAKRILDRVASVDLPHAYLENWVHEPEIEQLRSLLWERGATAGRPYIARSQAEHGGPHSGWFWDGRMQGGGALTDMLCHALGGNDYLLREPGDVEGDPGDVDDDGGDSPGGLEAVSVSADVETLKWARPEYADDLRERFGVDYETDPADDYARTTIRYEDASGTPVVSEATGSWCYVGSGVSRRIELLGPEYSGHVRSDDDASSVFFSDELASGEGWAEKQTATSGRMPIGGAGVVNGGFVAENRDAVDAFREGRNGRFDLHDGERVLRLCMAAYKSAEDGAEVRLAETDLSSYVPPPARE